MSDRYGWSPQVIAALTPYQQLAYLQTDKTDETTSTISFNDSRAYSNWLNQRKT